MPRPREHAPVTASPAFDDLEAPAAQPLPRLARSNGTQPSSGDAPKKKKKKSGKKKKQSGQGGDTLDKRVLAGVGAVGLAIVCGLGFVIYDGFIKAPSLFANWQGGMVDHEISKHLTVTQYVLILNDKNRAELTIVDQNPWIGVGTYTLKGDRLKLNLKDGAGRDERDREYKIARSLARPSSFTTPPAANCSFSCSASARRRSSEPRPRPSRTPTRLVVYRPQSVSANSMCDQVKYLLRNPTRRPIAPSPSARGPG